MNEAVGGRAGRSEGAAREGPRAARRAVERGAARPPRPDAAGRGRRRRGARAPRARTADGGAEGGRVRAARGRQADPAPLERRGRACRARARLRPARRGADAEHSRRASPRRPRSRLSARRSCSPKRRSRSAPTPSAPRPSSPRPRQRSGLDVEKCQPRPSPSPHRGDGRSQLVGAVVDPALGARRAEEREGRRPFQFRVIDPVGAPTRPAQATEVPHSSQVTTLARVRKPRPLASTVYSSPIPHRTMRLERVRVYWTFVVPQTREGCGS